MGNDLRHRRGLGPALLRVLLAALIGGAAGGLAGINSTPKAATTRGACFKAVRLLRFAVSAFETEHGVLPGFRRQGDGTVATADAEGLAELVRRQLTEPREESGAPDWHGTARALLDEIPLNPYTGSRELVIVPQGADAEAFASDQTAGWAYLPSGGADARGSLPPGLILPCGKLPEGRAADRATAVQEIGFEIEDYQRWR